MVHLALALASAVLALPTLTSLGVQAAPLPHAQQNDMNVVQNADSLVSLSDLPLPLRLRRSDGGRQRRALGKRSRQRIAWDEDGVQDVTEFPNPRQHVPTFVRRRSTSSMGRGNVQEGGGMDTPGGSMQGGVTVSSRRGYVQEGGGMDTPGGSMQGGVTVSPQRFRRDGAVSGVPGAISIVAMAAANSTNTTMMTPAQASQQAIASLLFSADNTTTLLTGTASALNHTTMYLAPAPANTTLASLANSTAPVQDVLVNLKMAVFDEDRAQLIDYCATYDPAPAAASGMTAQPCTTTPSAHASQLFTYTPASGFVHPVWAQNVVDAGNATVSNTTLFANDASASSPNSTLANATTTLVAYHLFQHFTLVSETAVANSTNATAAGPQSLYALVFVPDLSVYLLDDAATTTMNSTTVTATSTGAPLLAQDAAVPTATPSSASAITGATNSAAPLPTGAPAPDVQYGVDLTACGKPGAAACPQTDAVPVIMLNGAAAPTGMSSSITPLPSPTGV